ncbi:uncharacterized protein [Dysidea avara]|uniref:uncharacterized protein n=1 Tax=Dysidea avara TaxID=196820 RepID=UPI0033250EF7
MARTLSQTILFFRGQKVTGTIFTRAAIVISSSSLVLLLLSNILMLWLCHCVGCFLSCTVAVMELTKSRSNGLMFSSSPSTSNDIGSFLLVVDCLSISSWIKSFTMFNIHNCDVISGTIGT